MLLNLDYQKLAGLISAELRQKPAIREWLSPAQAAVYTGLPEKTLEEYRRKGTGPKFSRVGKHVRYNRRHIDHWLESCADEQTSRTAND